MSYCSKTIDQLLADAEPVVMFYASRARFPNQCIDHDDVAQFLRVEAWKLAKSYDKERKQWKNHLHTMLRFRLIDALRQYGCIDRAGNLKRRQTQCLTFTELSHEHDDNLAFDPADLAAGTETEIDFLEMESALSGESTATRALFLRFRGFKMHEIADQLGVSESRISQVLSESSTHYAIAIGRVRVLAGESS